MVSTLTASEPSSASVFDGRTAVCVFISAWLDKLFEKVCVVSWSEGRAHMTWMPLCNSQFGSRRPTDGAFPYVYFSPFPEQID